VAEFNFGCGLKMPKGKCFSVVEKADIIEKVKGIS